MLPATNQSIIIILQEQKIFFKILFFEIKPEQYGTPLPVLLEVFLGGGGEWVNNFHYKEAFNLIGY